MKIRKYVKAVMAILGAVVVSMPNAVMNWAISCYTWLRGSRHKPYVVFLAAYIGYVYIGIPRVTAWAFGYHLPMWVSYLTFAALVVLAFGWASFFKEVPRHELQDRKYNRQRI